MKYFLCGFSGSGKSTLLQKIQASEEYPGYLFVDLDDYVLSQNPEFNSLGELIELKGWEWFRNTEKQTLSDLLKSPNIWIALGGGTLDAELVGILNQRGDVKGYWLDVDFETCWQRIQNDQNRPLVQRGKSHLKNLYAQRLSLFQEYERLKLE